MHRFNDHDAVHDACGGVMLRAAKVGVQNAKRNGVPGRVSPRVLLFCPRSYILRTSCIIEYGRGTAYHPRAVNGTKENRL